MAVTGRGADRGAPGGADTGADTDADTGAGPRRAAIGRSGIGLKPVFCMI